MIRDSATIWALAATCLGLACGLVIANPTKREKGQELKEQAKEKRLFWPRHQYATIRRRFSYQSWKCPDLHHRAAKHVKVEGLRHMVPTLGLR